MKATLSASLVLAAAGLAAACPASARTYDVSADFSTISNPSPLNGGVWSYGYENALGLNFALDQSNNPQASSYNPAIHGWAALAGGFPYVAKNTSAASISYVSVTLKPGQIVMHPSSNDLYSVVRFTAPAAGTYSLDTAFTGLDSRPTTTDVHVLLDGTSLFARNIHSYEIPQSYSSALSLAAGDTVDFAVGYGSNGNNGFDSTGLAATLAVSPAVPEPSPLALLALGLLPVRLLAKKRRSA